MLIIPGGRVRFCDGQSRRSFLKIGGLALGSLSLPQLLQAEAQSGVGRSHRSLIMVFLAGGPPHQDMLDLKPKAPREYRGEFSPIATNVPGIEICELLPRIAGRMDRLAVLRSLVGSEGHHSPFQCHTGNFVKQQPPGGWPALGAVVSKLQGPVNPSTPAFISLFPKMKFTAWSDPGQPGFAGLAHAPFTPNVSGSTDLTPDGLTLASLKNRRAILERLDGLRRSLGANDVVDGMDTYYRQAFDILLSGRLAEALDVEREDPRVRERYGRGSPEPAGYGDAAPLLNEYFLAARRLIEAGARVVTLAYGRWDWHGRPHGTTFENARDHFPALDQALSALLDDLDERGMLDDVTVVVWGEFGRTPLINSRGGRDHWPQVAGGLLAGGGMRTGQVIGATNERAEFPTERPVHFQEVFATMYHNLGIDVERTTLKDVDGRPHYFVDHGKYQPLVELV